MAELNASFRDLPSEDIPGVENEIREFRLNVLPGLSDELKMEFKRLCDLFLLFLDRSRSNIISLSNSSMVFSDPKDNGHLSDVHLAFLNLNFLRAFMEEVNTAIDNIRCFVIDNTPE